MTFFKKFKEVKFLKYASISTRGYSTRIPRYFTFAIYQKIATREFITQNGIAWPEFTNLGPV